MDMNDLYLVVVRLRDWEFMAEASHINAKKAVRGLAADLQDFHEQGQRSSASHLMQQGSKMAEVLLDIATNASIRGMRVDGVDLFSVLDFIAYVCPGLSSCNVGLWRFPINIPTIHAPGATVSLRRAYRP
jgi:hypothetical protein